MCVCSFSRSRRQLAALDKESQYGFSADVGEEPPDLDPALSYYQLDEGPDAVFTPLLVRTGSKVDTTVFFGLILVPKVWHKNLFFLNLKHRFIVKRTCSPIKTVNET